MITLVSKNRNAKDFYQTPYSLSRLFLAREKLNGSILEPACGNGAIVKVLLEYGYKCNSSDIEDDFLEQNKQYNTIITNPPFSMAQEFIIKAKELAMEKICFLLPLNYLHGKKRYDKIWTDNVFPLKCVYIFTRYPFLSNEPLREDGKIKTGMMVYAWYVWDKTFSGEAKIKWLDNNGLVL